MKHPTKAKPLISANVLKTTLIISAVSLAVLQLSLPVAYSNATDSIKLDSASNRATSDLSYVTAGSNESPYTQARQTELRSELNDPKTILAHKSFGRFCIVHIGKTAGGTLSCRLGGNRLAKNCERKSLELSRSRFVRMAMGKIHKNRDWGCLKSKRRIPDTWLFTLRNPLDRIASWFYYEHPGLHNVEEIEGNRPALFNECYSSLDDLSKIGLQVAINYDASAAAAATGGKDAGRSNITDSRYSLSCAKRAYQAIAGTVGFQYHNFYNYEYYKDWVNHVTTSVNYTILVVRSEHLEEDWNRLERLYEGHPDNSVGPKPQQNYFSTVQRHRSNSTLDQSSNANLCWALCQEIKVYELLLRRAANLSPMQVAQSIEELHAKCPTSKLSAACSRPNILDVQDPMSLFPT